MEERKQNSLLAFLGSFSLRQKVIGVIVILMAVLLVVLPLAINNSEFSKYGAEREKSASHVDIVNFSEIASEIPEFYQVETESKIWDILTRYVDVEENVYVEAKIRDGSYSENGESSSRRTSSFIVDIPQLEISYAVAFDWTPDDGGVPDEYEVAIQCPLFSDVIYKDSDCKTSDDPFDLLWRYLPDTIEYNNNSIELDKEIYNDESYGAKDGRAYLNIEATVCDNDTEAQAIVMEKVDSWIAERLVNPDTIYKEFNYLRCGSE